MTTEILPADAPPPSLPLIFFSFMQVAILGFGGTMPWSRRMLVDVRKWMTAEEYNEAFALCQFLPGPNIINLSIVFGARVRGAAGATAAVVALVAPPTALMIIIGVIYAHYGDAQALQRILAGVSAAVAGLILGMFGMMLKPLLRGNWLRPVAIVTIVIIAIAILRIPMIWTLAVMCPLSIAFVWHALGRAGATPQGLKKPGLERGPDPDQGGAP
jgi:chromate transporter